MSRSFVKAEARKLVIGKLDTLLVERSGLTGREAADITHEVERLKDRLEKDVRSLVRNRDYAVKGQAQ